MALTVYAKTGSDTPHTSRLLRMLALRQNRTFLNVAFDPNVWSGRALQEVSSSWRSAVLHQCIRSLIGAVLLRTNMDISARAISLTDRPQLRHVGHQGSHAPGRPILHLFSFSRRPRRVRDVGYVIYSSSPRAFSLFRPGGRSFLPPSPRNPAVRHCRQRPPSSFPPH